jgi:hypothetical protein
MFTKNLKDQFSADLLNTVRSVLGEAKHDKDCECKKCEKEEEDDEDEDEKDEMKEGKRGLWDNIHAKRKRIKAGSGERMRKPGSEGAPTNADFKAASEEADAPKLPFDGPYRKAGEKRKDQYGNEIKNVAKHLAKKAMNAQKNEEVEQIDELSKGTMGSYVNKAKDQIDAASYRQGHRDSRGAGGNNPASNAIEKKLSKRHKGIETAVSKLTKEESEQIDELSKATMGRYINKAATKMGSQGVTAGLKIAADEKSSKNFKDMGKREKGIKLAVSKLTKEEQDFIDALNADTLEEGRGRPPKEGSAAWKARQGKADDDMVALGMQLRKAQSINKKVRFMDSKEHDIHPNHINRFNDHMASRRTSQEKAAFQKQAHKSHADFVKAVSAPVPKAAKDTGEIVKYRH